MVCPLLPFTGETNERYWCIAVIVDKDADLNLALQGVLFAAVGTAWVLSIWDFFAHERSLTNRGQRCTSTRRVYLHTSIAKQFTEMLLKNYNSPSNLPIGDPLDSKTMIGPLHTSTSVERYIQRLESIKKNGGVVLNENSGQIGTLENWEESSGGNWVRPAIAKPVKDDPCWKEEYVSFHPSPINDSLKKDLMTEHSHLSSTFPNSTPSPKQSP
jgi:aldehyde dehydrogenase family 7 protein A1